MRPHADPAHLGIMVDMLTHTTGNQIYQSIVDHATEAILLLDAQSRIFDVNHRTMEMLRYSRDDLKGKHLLDLVAEEFRKECEKLLINDSPTERSFTKISFRCGTGEFITTEIHLSHLNGSAVVFCRDIGRRKILEEELRNLASAVRAAADAIFITDTQGMIYFVNPSFEHLTGYSPEEILGRTPRILKSGLVSHEVYELLWRTVLSGQDWRGELTNRRKNGEIYEADVTITPIKGENNQVVSFLSVQRDITHRKRLERQLEEYTESLERRVRARTEALSKLHEISELIHSVMSLDKVLQVILVAVTAGDGFRFNRAFLLLVNEEEKTISGKMAIGPSTPEEAGRIWNEMRYLPKHGNLAETLESYLVSSDKTNLDVNRTARQLTVSLDDDSSILVRALREQQGFNVVKGHAEVFSNAVISRYPGSGESLQMRHEPAELCDVAVSRHLNTDSFAVVPLLWRQGPVGCLIVDNLINREPITDADLWILELFAEQAALAIVHTRLIARLERDKYRMQIAYRDLEESQAKLVEAQTMAGLGRMAATVAHEVRTPIVAIGGFAKRLSQDIRNRHSRRILDIIRSEALRLEETLDTILFYVKPALPKKKPGNLNELIETLCLYFAQETSEQNIDINLELEETLPAIPFDDRQIRQVILNVIQNAVHAMEDGGTLTIRTSQENEWILLEIRDTGSGIPEEDLSNVFKEFFTTKNKGTGLGLHVSSRIVENHGGRIVVKSTCGVGTNVYIHLPITAEVPDGGQVGTGEELGVVDGRR
ncbi:MAG: PAS domain S-box protein [bacterium]